MSNCGVIIFGPRGKTKSLAELARCYYTVHVPLLLQIPECSAGMLEHQSTQDVQLKDIIISWFIVILPLNVLAYGKKKLLFKFKCWNFGVFSFEI